MPAPPPSDPSPTTKRLTVAEKDVAPSGEQLRDQAGGPADPSRDASRPAGAHPSRVGVILDCDEENIAYGLRTCP